VGIWTGLTVSLAIVGLLLVWRVRVVLWKRPIHAVSSRSPRAREAAAALEAQENLAAVGTVVAGD
jgi:hypothetical protein